MKASSMKYLAIAVWALGSCVLLALATPARGQVPEQPDAWFYDANQTFMGLRSKIQGKPDKPAAELRPLREQCLIVTTEYNKRAAEAHPGVFKLRSLPQRLSAQDCA